MDEEEDDMYAQEELPVPTGNGDIAQASFRKEEKDEEEGEEVEGEEEDETDSDIDIITERKGDQKAEQPTRVSAFKIQPPGRTSSTDLTSARKDSPATKNEISFKETPARSGASYPAAKTSNIDVDARPVYESTGKSITDIDLDTDFPEDDKPWRRPGTDMTDFFNYGFDEFTWASYCLKQQTLRKEVTDSKKQMEEMQSFLSMPGGMPPMPAMPGPPGSAQSVMPTGGPADMPPEMQQMMSQMMAQGMDPSQMDPAAFFQMMQGGQGGANDPSQNFGGQGYGQQGNQQQMGYGFGGGGGTGAGRNQGGRGRGHRW